MDNEETRTVDYLIMSGALEVAGIDEKTGEFLYTFTPKIKEIMPEMYNQHLNHVNTEIMRLWEMGYVNLDLLAEEPVVTITEKALDPNEIAKLSKNDQWSIEEIKRLLKRPEL